MYTGVVIEFTNEKYQWNGYVILPSFEDADRFMKEPQLYITHNNMIDYVTYFEPKLCNWHYENKKVVGCDKEFKIQVYEIIS